MLAMTNEPILNDLSSPARYIASRRSCRPRDMVAPGPDADTLRDIVTDALRSPDHGKLAPWRVVHIGKEHRDDLSRILQSAYHAEKPDAGRLELEAMDLFAHHAPELLVVLYSPRESSKIPAWEQQLSAGAFTMNLLHAAHVRGFVGGWITGWPAYNDDVRDHFGTENEHIAGFIYLGTAGKPLEERARPTLADVYSKWTPSR